MKISIENLSAFVKMAHHLSVSVAAQQLGISKSMVSKRVAQLELEVDATLFSRSTRKIALTPAGELYLDFATRTVHDAFVAYEQVRDLRAASSGELNGLLRITAPVSWGQHVLAPQLTRFLELHQGVEIELHLTDRLMDLAYERIDLALRWTCLPAHSLVVEPVARVKWNIVAAPSYLKKVGKPREPSDLETLVCMSYWQQRTDDQWLLSKAKETKTINVGSRFHANNPEAIEKAAIAGFGIALLPHYACDQSIKRKKLTRLLPGWTIDTKFGDTISAVCKPECARMARNRALKAFLRQENGWTE